MFRRLDGGHSLLVGGADDRVEVPVLRAHAEQAVRRPRRQTQSCMMREFGPLRKAGEKEGRRGLFTTNVGDYALDVQL